MSEKLDKVVQISITRETRSISQKGFGTALILGPNATFPVNTAREYADIDGVAADFAAASDEYKAADWAFKQQPRVEKVKIARSAAKVAQVQKLTVSADFVDLNKINMKIDGVAIAEVTYAVSHADTMTALAAAIQASTSIATAQVTAAREITITAQNAGIPFVCSDFVVTLGATQPTATFTITTPNVGVTEDLTAIVLNDDDWYALLMTSTVPAEVKQAVAWIESHYKIFLTRTSDTKVYDPNDSTDIASFVSNGNYDRTSVIFNETAGNFIDAGWAGKCMPFVPGSLTWMFKTVVGATPSNLSETQITAIKNKNANIYTTIAGFDMMEWGKMGSGEYIDVIGGMDWIRFRMAENVFGKLANSLKIPYTDAGVAIIEAQIRATLENAMKIGILAPAPDLFSGQEYLVTVPKVSAVSANDKANRLLPDVTWQAQLAGAVHKVIIQGRVQI